MPERLNAGIHAISLAIDLEFFQSEANGLRRTTCRLKQCGDYFTFPIANDSLVILCDEGVVLNVLQQWEM